MTWQRFVAVGDSFTEGLHDEVLPDGTFRGWADRVAEDLSVTAPTLQYANLAVRGKLLDEVVADQVGRTLDLEPDLVSFHAGGNDLLRPGVDPADVAERYAAAVASLAERVRTVVIFTVLERSGGRGAIADRLASRIAPFNAAVRQTAHQTGAMLVDLAAAPVMSDRRLWDQDRLHLAPHGHQRVAAALLDGLATLDAEAVAHAHGWWKAELPQTVAKSFAHRLVDDAQWVTRHLAPWVMRRIRGVSSGDGLTAKREEPRPLAGDPGNA